MAAWVRRGWGLNRVGRRLVRVTSGTPSSPSMRAGTPARRGRPGYMDSRAPRLTRSWSVGKQEATQLPALECTQQAASRPPARQLPCTATSWEVARQGGIASTPDKRPGVDRVFACGWAAAEETRRARYVCVYQWMDWVKKRKQQANSLCHGVGLGIVPGPLLLEPAPSPVACTDRDRTLMTRASWRGQLTRSVHHGGGDLHLTLLPVG